MKIWQKGKEWARIVQRFYTEEEKETHLLEDTHYNMN